MKYCRSILVLVVAIGLGFRACAEPLVVNGINAIVHDSIITYQEVRDRTDPSAVELRREYSGSVLEQKLLDAYKQNKDELIERQLVLHEFEAGGYNLPESIIDEQLEEYIKNRPEYGDRVTLIKTLREEGKTYEQFRQEFKERFIYDEMNYENISKQVIVSPHKIEVYYLDHKDDFKEEDKVKLRMIVLTNAPETDTAPTRKLAEEILAKLNQGAAFGEMASIYSQGSQAKQQGEWDWVDKSVLRKELADVAFTMKPGEHSGIIETPGAFYIMLVEDKKTAHVRDLSEVRDEIEKILLAKERTRLHEQWIEKLKKKTFVREFPF